MDRDLLRGLAIRPFGHTGLGPVEAGQLLATCQQAGYSYRARVSFPEVGLLKSFNLANCRRPLTDQLAQAKFQHSSSSEQGHKAKGRDLAPFGSVRIR